MNKYKKYIVLFIGFILYFVVGSIFDFYLPCPIYRLTGFYCPGCGTTRMFLALFHLNFYQAFRYNQLNFILLPFFLVFFINYLITIKTNKEPLYKRIPTYIYIIIMIICIVFGILRNIIPYLAPTDL